MNMYCDICKVKRATYEVFVETRAGYMMVLSLCSTECESKCTFRIISNPISLDKTVD